MAVGEREPSDVDFDNTADLIIDGQRFPNQDVRGDTEAPKRRDVFIDNMVRDEFPPPDGLPDNATVVWQGRRRRAELSFRRSAAGGAVPVYQFFVESRISR